ncbi:2'-5' RNA ligase family protein [uncultured Friedmanniella sp.]|uniref:2'-5' RNA ligase family protein n=1 Tax=uncultured Friedmanniella sp. TaxID=335381 RepID=UPI0035CAB588
MTQSVELTLDDETDRAVREQWAALAEAGLPTEQRVLPSPSHRPHITLYAGPTLDSEADERLPGLFAGLRLRFRIGAVLLFGPRRGQVVLVRQVVVGRELLALQEAVATLCGASPEGQFGPGRWTPHVTLARRVPTGQVGAVLTALGEVPELDAVSRDGRRWDSDRRETWSL